MKNVTSKIMPMRPPAPTTPPTIAPVLDRFEVTEAPIVLLDLSGGIKEVCTTRFVDVASTEEADVNWNRLNQ